MSANNQNWIERVYEIVRNIPKGKVCTYGHIADTIGTRATARMVGWAMNLSHTVNPKVPAHRVVNRNGLLTGRMHFATPTLMQELLEAEGLIIEDHQIKDFKKHLWIPY